LAILLAIITATSIFRVKVDFETKITLREQRHEPYVYFIETWWQNTKTWCYWASLLCRSRM